MNKLAPYCLLALCNITPDKEWRHAENTMLGISQIMEFLSIHWDLHYAPNTRESFRKGPIKELLAHNIIELNPDNPDRPLNSGKTVYQIKYCYFQKLKQLSN